MGKGEINTYYFVAKIPRKGKIRRISNKFTQIGGESSSETYIFSRIEMVTLQSLLVARKNCKFLETVKLTEFISKYRESRQTKFLLMHIRKLYASWICNSDVPKF